MEFKVKKKTTAISNQSYNNTHKNTSTRAIPLASSRTMLPHQERDRAEKRGATQAAWCAEIPKRENKNKEKKKKYELHVHKNLAGWIGAADASQASREYLWVAPEGEGKAHVTRMRRTKPLAIPNAYLGERI